MQFTKEDMNKVLSEVEQEIEKTLGSMVKKEEEIDNEEIDNEEEVEMSKSEEETQEDEYETIDDLYASMEKSELEAHYASVKKAVFGEEVESDMNKSEKEVEDEKEDITKMMKSENENLKSENETLKKSLEDLNGLVERLVNRGGKKAPKQKSITETYDVIKKSEEDKEEEGINLSSLTKSEVTSKLKKLDYSELSKNDREAINQYCLENRSVDIVKHLIKE